MHKTCVSYQNFQKVPTMGGGYSPPPRGWGYFHMYAYWVCGARETPIFSPEFPFRSISFSQITQKSVPEHHHYTFFDGFCRSGDYHFQNFFNFNPFIASHGRRFRRLKFSRSKRIKLVPEPCIFTLKTAQARSGARIFKLDPEHRRFTLDRELVTEPLPIFHFAAAHTYQNFGWVPPPPCIHPLGVQYITYNNINGLPAPCTAIIIHFQLE